MSFSDASDEKKFVVIFSEKKGGPYTVYVHPNAKAPSRFSCPENSLGMVKMLRRRYEEAFCVREDRVLDQYGVSL